MIRFILRRRVERTDCALYERFSWLEDVAVKNWNQRPEKKDAK